MIPVILWTLVLIVTAFLLFAPLESLRWWRRADHDDVAAAFLERARPRAEGSGAPTGDGGGGTRDPAEGGRAPMGDGGTRDLAEDGVAPTGDGGADDRAAARAIEASRPAADGSDAGELPSVVLVYLSGIGVLDQTEQGPDELAFLEGVRSRIPGARATADVFPYSVENRGLLERTTTWIWRRLGRTRENRSGALLPMLINLRNLLQVMVSADPRYGPTYSLGTAEEIYEAISRQGFDGSCPVVIIGYSGGAQVAAGASWFLGSVGIEVSIVSVGGVYTNDPGLDHVQHLWHLYGAKDSLQRRSLVMFPGRWPRAGSNSYGRARDEGRIVNTEIGPMAHSGTLSYFSRDDFVEDGRSHARVLEDAVVERVTGLLAERARGAEND